MKGGVVITGWKIYEGALSYFLYYLTFKFWYLGIEIENREEAFRIIRLLKAWFI